MRILRTTLGFLLISLSQQVAQEPQFLSDEFVVWNVGQGLWTTLVEGDSCQHFDAGGEHAPWKQLRKYCGGKINSFNFSHWDFDHISFAARLPRQLKNVCLETAPSGKGNTHKQRLLKPLSVCAGHDSSARTIEGSPHGRSANDLSHVFIAASPTSQALALIPGDSSSHEERFWTDRLPEKKLWLLVLGHHGSRTSTSSGLVRHLPNVHMAIASSRQAKYGHPHLEVVRRLKAAGIALLRTEDWGHLHFEFPKDAPAPRAGSVVDSLITVDKVCIRGSSCGRPVHRSRGRRTH